MAAAPAGADSSASPRFEPSRREERPVDPDSPFAVLKELKLK